MGTSVSAWSTRSMCPGLAQLAGLSFSTGPLRPRNSPGAWRHPALQLQSLLPEPDSSGFVFATIFCLHYTGEYTSVKPPHSGVLHPVMTIR